MKKYILSLLFFLFTGISSLEAQTGSLLDVSGYLKELGQLSVSNAVSTLRYDNIIHHRIETKWRFSDHFEFRTDMRTRLLSGYSIEHTPGLDAFFENDPDYLDLSWVWIDSEKSILHSNIDRMQASYFYGPFEMHLGRQRINWGRSYIWNPNDLFNNYAFLDFDYEERPGVDAFLAQYNWSYASGFEAGFRMADTFDEMVIAGMLRTSLGTYDVQILGGHYLGNIALGGGWAGYINDAGFKGEITYFHPEDRFSDEFGHITATAGVDYMFSNSLFVQGEILYNGGFKKPLNPLGELTEPPSADNLFIAETGIFLSGSYPLHPLINTSLSLLGSFDRSIYIVIPQIAFSVAENVDLLLLSQFLKGRVFNATLETPNLIFLRLKWSY